MKKVLFGLIFLIGSHVVKAQSEPSQDSTLRTFVFTDVQANTLYALLENSKKAFSSSTQISAAEATTTIENVSRIQQLIAQQYLAQTKSAAPADKPKKKP